MSERVSAESGNAGVLQPDTRFRNRYRVLRVIKSGGMGAVYEVMDEATATRRALKVMLPSLIDSEELRARFALEARITGSIESDHIVKTSDAGVDEQTGTPFLVMELLRGEELGSLVKKRGSLPPEEVAIYLFQASLALDRTHAANIVHRDLKPDNLFVTVRDDGSPCVKILDFGIAKVLERHHASTLTRQMLGTPVYMAPEQIRAERNVGPRVDIHALGHVAYALLSGESYWAEEAEVIPSPFLLAGELLRGPIESPALRARRRRNIALPQSFDAWFFKATALKAEDRFDRASTAVQELAAALGVALPRVSRVVLLPEAPAAPPPQAGPTEPTLRSQSGGEPQRLADMSTVTVPAINKTPISRPGPRAAAKEPENAAAGAANTESRSTPAAAALNAESRPVPTPVSRPPDTSLRASPGSTRVASRTPHTLAEASKKTEASSRRDRGSQRRFHVHPDAATGILRVKVWGFWDAEEGKAYLEEFRQKAKPMLGKPWYVLADIADFPAQKPEVTPFVEQTMAFARENGMRRAANLVSSALTKMQISRQSADMGLPEFSFFQDEAAAIAWLLKEG